jgi:hypothetical protein
MGRSANHEDRELLREAIEKYPERKKRFFARLLEWHPQKVERELAYLECDCYLLQEDEAGRIAPFQD